ncbi:MAG: ABC transporter substrate-binding protein [Caldicoprobacterales bacterium]|jgi:putative ABC transport system substrate-binding protein
MKRKNQIITIVLTVVLLALVLMTSGCASQTGADKQGGTKNYNIGIIQYAEHVALDSAREGFVDALKDNGYVDGENITLDIQNAQADPSNLSTISDRFVSNNCDLILAIATSAAQAIAGKTTEIPILATAITDFVEARLVDSNEAPGGNVSGTSDMNPVKEQIDLLVRLAPEAKTIGVIYTSSEPNSVVQARIAKEAVEKLDLNFAEVTITNSNDVQQAVQSLVEKCDAIYIPTDNILASAMPTVYGATAKTKTPVVCGEIGMVENGGLASYGINYYDLGYQTGEMAVSILKGEAKPADMPVQTASKYHYAVNGTIAQEFGIAVPEDLQEYVFEMEQ